MQPRDRRTTLGIVPSSTFNAPSAPAPSLLGKSRVSMGAARIATAAPASRSSVGVMGGASLLVSAAAAPPAPKSRVSIAGAGGPTHRRSSAGIRGVTSDPRPIGTAAFTREQVDTLITFLMEHSYDRDISPKLLKAPTATEFENIFIFLAKQLDPTFRIRDKVTNDVPEFMKLLKYPFSLSKTALVAVGTQHNWPNCLASLTWMVELINVRASLSAGCFSLSLP